ncbi:MAG: hypothetical protein IKO47_13205 [Ruminococcus sp.]|nr:hypothetical protein [Ruminococcus sp.]
MDVSGMWKIVEINAMDQDFKQTWKKVAEIADDPTVSDLQKMMTKSLYVFEEGGRFLQLFPKEFNDDPEAKDYDDRFVLGHEGKWKLEDGKLYAEGDDEDEWTEFIPVGDDGTLEIFGFFRIAKA